MKFLILVLLVTSSHLSFALKACQFSNSTADSLSSCRCMNSDMGHDAGNPTNPHEDGLTASGCSDFCEKKCNVLVPSTDKKLRLKNDGLDY